MGSFKKLVNILLGTKKEYVVKDLGIFHSKVCDWWQNEHYTWWSTVQLPSYSAETVIWLEGDASAPLSQQLLDLQALLEDWKSVIARVYYLMKADWHIKKKHIFRGRIDFIRKK